jgi:Zn-dependent peptidase ImmA (M78 family)
VQTVPINPAVLAWAIEESGDGPDVLARRMKVDARELASWLAGDARPTMGQWTALAAKLKRPKSLFLLPAPPAPTVPPDLRTAAGRNSHALGSEELLQVRRARRLQRYLGSLRAEMSEEPRALPSLAVDADVELAGVQLRGWLDVPVEEQLAWSSGSVALGAWRRALEESGIVVLQLRLGKNGIRGFSLLHEGAPVVAVNTAETNEARSFTLMHELAHLASRSESSCALPPAPSGVGSAVERWCDRVASVVLLPAETVRAEVQLLRSSPRAPQDDVALSRRVATRLKTSLRAAALRLMALGLADASVYARIEAAYPNRDRDKGGGGGRGGERAPVQRLRELGPATADTMLRALAERRLTERDARDLLRLEGAELLELGALLDVPGS